MRTTELGAGRKRNTNQPIGGKCMCMYALPGCAFVQCTYCVSVYVCLCVAVFALYTFRTYGCKWIAWMNVILLNL